jgi:hypothetical protein
MGKYNDGVRGVMGVIMREFIAKNEMALLRIWIPHSWEGILARHTSASSPFFSSTQLQATHVVRGVEAHKQRADVSKHEGSHFVGLIFCERGKRILPSATMIRTSNRHCWKE